MAVKPTDVNKMGSEQGLRKTNYISGPGRQRFDSTKPSNGNVALQMGDLDDTPVNMGFMSGNTKPSPYKTTSTACVFVFPDTPPNKHKIEIIIFNHVPMSAKSEASKWERSLRMAGMLSCSNSRST